MHIARKVISSALGGLIVLGMAGAAFAAPAVATGSVNVRSGPSTQYQRVDTLQRNQLVEVTGCRSGWCYVEKRGADGWVSANYLQQVRPQSQRSTQPAISFSFNFGNPPVVRPRHDDNRGHWNGPGRGNGGRDDHRGNGGRDDHRGNNWNGNRNNSGINFQFGN